MFASKLAKEISMRKGGHSAEIFYSESIEATYEYFGLKAKESKFDAAVFLGGDGTFGIAVDAMIKTGFDVPVAIFPLGTVNDFAKHLGMQAKTKKCVDVLLSGNVRQCDVAKVNGSYVVNVACGGYFTHGANTYSRAAKKVFGKMAYYGKAVFNLFDMHAQNLKFVVDGKEMQAETIMYLILNSPSAGGFKKIGAQAKIDDGFFDLCVIKKGHLGALLATGIRILGGNHIPDSHILYVKGKHFEIDFAEGKHNSKFDKSDIDGNVGPSLPLVVDVVPQKIRVFSRK